MQTMMIFGAGMFGKALSDLIAPSVRLVGFADNNSALRGTLAAGLPVVSVEEAVRSAPDIAYIGIGDERRSSEMREKLLQLGYRGEIRELCRERKTYDLRASVIRRLLRRLDGRQIEGCMAELGVYRGETAALLNRLSPCRRLYLFDTFEGFPAGDLAAERTGGYSRAREGDFSDTSAEAVMARMEHPESVVLRKGCFPETAEGIGERFAFVSLDADLYAPTLAGLRFFYPRMVPSGVLVLHDCDSLQFRGAGEALKEFEDSQGGLCVLPLNDLHGSVALLRP